jgi:hypothetical protein
MKKIFAVFLLLAVLIGGAVWYFLSGAGDLIRTQIEQQGSKYLGTQVSVFNVDLAISEGRLTISDVDVENPAGFSKEDAFSLSAITLDLGSSVSEPYVVQNVAVLAPEVLYEVDANGQGNLIVLKDNLSANLPKTDEPANTEDGANPLVIVEKVTVEGVRLKLNFEQLSTGDLAIETKAYEVTLPTFTAGPIGKPNGMPADQVGLAIVNEMLVNVIAQAKAEAKKRLKEEAKKKLDEKVDKEKEKLKEKAANKLKDLLGNG